MKKPFIKILIILSIIFISFFVGKTSALASGFENSIKCTYVLPIDYNIGNVGNLNSEELKITYEDGNFVYVNTYNNNPNEKFKEGSFNKYINGKGDGSKEKRGENYRTCPSYIRFRKVFNDYIVEPITFNTFKEKLDQIDSSKNAVLNSNIYVTSGVKIENGEFVASNKNNITGMSAIVKSYNPYPLYLKEQVIDGKVENGKAKEAIKNYFNFLYGFSGDNSQNIGSTKTLNITDDLIKIRVKYSTESGTYITVKKQYVNITNYDFNDYESFKKYCLSDYSKKIEYDANMSKSEWENRQIMFYYIDNYNRLISLLQKDSIYSKIYPTSYKDTAYNTIIYLKNISSVKNFEVKMKEADERNESKLTLSGNICVAECADETGKIPTNLSTLSNCQLRNPNYIKCDECRTKNCANVPAGSLEACIKGCYGEENYNRISEIRDNNAEALEQLTKTLYSVSAPSLTIKFDNRYKVNCSDFETLHTIYLILEITAPIAVIVLGSLDYAKAVMASDIEKMEKSKKKFPKRLLLLLLFVFVPIIIQIMLNLFSSSNDGIDLDTNLMKCIISGK